MPIYFFLNRLTSKINSLFCWTFSMIPIFCFAKSTVIDTHFVLFLDSYRFEFLSGIIFFHSKEHPLAFLMVQVSYQQILSVFVCPTILSSFLRGIFTVYMFLDFTTLNMTFYGFLGFIVFKKSILIHVSFSL